VKDSGPVGALRSHIGMHWIWLHCCCGRATQFDPADLADRLGLDLRMRQLVARAQCGKCGARGKCSLTIQPPCLPNGSDKPRAVPGVNEPTFVTDGKPRSEQPSPV